MKYKIKVLLLTLNSSIGGTEKMVLSLAENLDKNIFDCSICALIGDGTLIREAQSLGIKSFDLKMRGPLDLRVIPKLASLIRDEGVNILHTYLYHTNILGRIVGRHLGVPVVISSQRSTDNWRRFYHRLADKWTSGMADVIISNSLAGKRRLIETEGIREDKIKVIYNGIHVNKSGAHKNGEGLKKFLGIGKEDKVIGTVANLKPAKGLEYFIQAAPNVLKFYPHAKFVIVGYGPLKRNLESLAAELNISENVIFTDYKREVLDYIALFDIFVLPSLWEGTPVALMEAMALGKPVIATDVGGVSEIVDHHVNGLLIPPKDPVWIYESVLTLLTNHHLSRRFGENARKKIERDFPVSKMVQETEEIYKKLYRQKTARSL